MRMVLIWSSAFLVASATVAFPVAMLVSISWMTLADSTSAHFGAIGTNQLFFAASALALLPSTAAALSSRLVALGSAPLAISASCDWVSVKILIHSCASALFSLLPLTPSADPPRKLGMPSPAVLPGIGTEATLPLIGLSISGEFASFGSCRMLCTAPASQPLP